MVTILLRAWRAGDHAAFNELARLIYDELHRLAAFHLRGEYRDHGLRPTELVSEVYLRLASNEPLEFADRSHFFATVSRNMRRILVDHARKRAAVKRGGGDAPMEFDERSATSARLA
jgi:RNA polymerase sigma factor (TIGR02999 family)